MSVHKGLAVALVENVTNALVGCVRHGRTGRILWREVARMVPAAIVRALCGPAGRYVTGQTINANGGMYFN
jgi:uncharacterized membrane protein YfcA